MSVPTLFDKSETSFTTNGLGRLVGSVSCQVTEEGNGLYELEMRYLASDSMYQYLVQDNIIKVKLDDDRGYQCFDIYKVSLPINGIVTVNARHMCYRMNYIPIKPFSATGITATLQGLTNNALEVNPFVLSSDITNETSEYNQIEPKSLKACIGGTDGSILDIFSGSGAVELEYDNFNVHIWNHRGSDNGVQIRYGKNLTGFNYTRNTEDSYTGAIGYWHDTDQTVNYYGDVQYNSNVGDYGYKKTVIVDFSEQQDTAPTRSQLNAWALAYITNIGVAKENITVNFVNLADTEEYKNIAPLETVGLFDTVHVFYEPYGLTVEKKVIKTVYDVLKERYTSIEIGDKKSSLSNTLIETSATVSKMVSVTQKIDREIGTITSTIGEIEEGTTIAEKLTQIEQTTSSIKLRVDNTLTNENQQFHLSTSSAQLAYAQLTPGSTKIVGSGIAPLSSSQVSTIRSAAWSDNAPKLLAGTWLWGREKLAHTDSEGTVTYTYGEPYLWEAISDNAYQGSAINMYADRIQLQVTEQKSDIAKNATGIAENKSLIEQTSKDITARVEEVYADERSNYAQLSVSLDSISSSVYKEIKDTGDNLQKQIDGFNNYTTDDIKGLITNEIQTDDTIKDLVGFVNKSGETVELASTMLDANGFHVETANTNNSVTITGDGLTVIDKDNETLLSATDDGVDMKDATVRNYLNIDYSTYGFRFETYSDNNDSNQLGIYGW